MSLTKLFITLSLIAFGAITLAHAQSTCAPEQRKELVLTAVDKEGKVIENFRAQDLSLKVGGAPATIAPVASQKCRITGRTDWRLP